MGKYYSINYYLVLPGFIIAIIIFFLFLIILIVPLFYNYNPENLFHLIKNNYLLKIIYFSFLQSIISTLLSVIIGLIISLTLYRRKILAQIIQNLNNIIFVLPVLVSIVAIINIYGREGILSEFFQLLNLKYDINLYNIFGIIIVHMFFNVPLATNIFLKKLQSIKIEQYYLASYLNLSHWKSFVLIEWPQLKSQFLSISSIIFTLCFSSFTAVLTFGGGSKTSNIEVAIFHFLNYEFNPYIASVLSIIKIIFCIFLNKIINSFDTYNLKLGILSNYNHISRKNNAFTIIIDTFSITILIFLLILPLLSLIIRGINTSMITLLCDSLFWESIRNALIIAFLSSFISLLVSILLILSSRELFFHNFKKISYLIEDISLFIFSIPTIVLSTSITIILSVIHINIYRNVSGLLIILLHSFMTIPFIFKLLKNEFFFIRAHYQTLCLSLNIQGWMKIKLIELKYLKPFLVYSFAMSCILSIGDNTIISMINNQDFITISSYLYQKTMLYQNKESCFISLFLLFLCFLIFIILNKVFNIKNYDNS